MVVLPVVAHEPTPQLHPTTSDFGGIGLIQTPNARFAPTGEFIFGSTYHQDYWHFTLSMQLTEWLESTLRYTIVNDVLYSTNPNYSDDTRFTDKGIELKLRLLKERQWLPEIALGIRDFGGSGVFDGEYLVMSKHWQNWDFSLGLGWGYLGNSGNLYSPSLGDDKCQRRNSYTPQGGELEAHRWFTGCIGWFAGVQYQTPIEGLQLKLEYEANDYRNDRPVLKGVDNMTQSSRWNVGLWYQFAPWGDVRLSYQRGNTLTVGVNLLTNFHQMQSHWQPEPSLPLEILSSQIVDLTVPKWAIHRQALKAHSGLDANALYFDHESKSLTLWGEHKRYREKPLGHRRSAEWLTSHFEGVKTWRVVEQKNGLNTTQLEWQNQDIKTVMNGEDIEQTWQNVFTETPPIKTNQEPHWRNTERFNASLTPHLQQSLGGAESFYFFHVGLNGNAEYAFAPNWIVNGSLYLNLLDNYDQFNYQVPPDGTMLPRVRTLIRQYLQNRAWLSQLKLTHYQEYSKNWYQRFYLGYLESMFAGGGTEVLYRPWRENWAIGADINYVKQRDPHRALGLFHDRWHQAPYTKRDYQVQTGVWTGHLSAYYQPKWRWLDDTLWKLSIGQYLAGDRGVTLDVSKQFASGVIAGAYATFTNLSAKEYGEGSYTKGIYVSIPFDLMTIHPSTQRAHLNWTPLTRDGGQMLNTGANLFGLTDARYPWYTRPAKPL